MLLTSSALPSDSTAAERAKPVDEVERRVEEELRKGVRSTDLSESQRQELVRQILRKGTTPTQAEIEKVLRDWSKANPPIHSQKLDFAALARAIDATVKEPNSASQPGMKKPSYDPHHGFIKTAMGSKERTGKTERPSPDPNGRHGQIQAKSEYVGERGPNMESKPEQKPEKPEENHQLGQDHPQHPEHPFHLPDAGGDAGH